MSREGSGQSLSDRLADASRRNYGEIGETSLGSPEISAAAGMFRPDALFEPFQLGRLMLKNRVVMAPMTRNFSPDGVPGPEVADYYRRRAKGGAGLIVTEGAFVPHPAAGFTSVIPAFHGEAALLGWRRVVDAVHSEGGRIFPQLWHTGLMPMPTDDIDATAPVSPSGLFVRGDRRCEPTPQETLREVIEAFANAAENAVAAGFDGIQIHAAHGYLIDQFFWSETNQRDDAFGGNMEDRSRLGLEIVRECRRSVGPDFPISLRFSQWKQQDFTARLAETPQELERFLAPFVDAGVDLFDCSTRRFWEPEFAGSDMNLAGWTRRITGVPTVTVGSVSLSQDFFFSLQSEVSTSSNLGRLLEMLGRGDFDLVGVGRALIVDPDWPQKVAAGRLDELLPYTPESLNTLV